MSWRTVLLAGLLVVAGCGRGGGVVVYGFGETIDHLASFDEATASLVSEQFDFVEPAVGLHYEYLSLFFLDVWTSDGDVVF